MPDPPQPTLPRTALPDEVIRASLEALDRGQRVVVATVIARHGSAPSTAGQKLVLAEDGLATGTIGGGAVEHAVLRTMTAVLADPASVPRVESFRLGAELGMCCGGSVEILIEPIRPAAHVLVIGAGHVGGFTAPLLASLGFRVTLCDGREDAADPARLAANAAFGAPVALGPDSPLEVGHAPLAPTAPPRVLHADYDDPEVARALPARLEGAACLVMTHDHQLDQAAIEWALARGFGFVGGVGSRAKAARTRARLEAKGARAEDIERVRMPVGLDVGARSPAEIAVAIAGELIGWRARLAGAQRHVRDDVATAARRGEAG